MCIVFIAQSRHANPENGTIDRGLGVFIILTLLTQFYAIYHSIECKRLLINNDNIRLSVDSVLTGPR